jgi:hypothetical protein
MNYITIRKISKYQFWWAEVEKVGSVEKIKWIDESTAKFLSSSYGIDPTTIATTLNKGSSLDELIRVPLSFLESKDLKEPQVAI